MISLSNQDLLLCSYEIISEAQHSDSKVAGWLCAESSCTQTWLTSNIFCWHSCSAKNFSLSVEISRRQAGESFGRYDTWAWRNPVSLNLGRQRGVQLSAERKLVEAFTKLNIRWTSDEERGEGGTLEEGGVLLHKICLLTQGQEIVFLGFDVCDKLVVRHQNHKQHILQNKGVCTCSGVKQIHLWLWQLTIYRRSCVHRHGHHFLITSRWFHRAWLHFRRARVGMCVWCSYVHNTG